MLCEYLVGLGGLAAKRNLHLSALRGFFDRLVNRHVVVLNPAATVKGVKDKVIEGKTPEIKLEQARTLLASIQVAKVVDDGQGGTIETPLLVGLRDRAILATLKFTACRAGAVAKLRLGDFQHDGTNTCCGFRRRGARAGNPGAARSGRVYPAEGPQFLEKVRSRRVGTQLDSNLRGMLPVLPPLREPLLQQLGRDLGLNQVLKLRRSLAHRLGRRGASRRSHQGGVQPRSSDQRLRRAIGRLQQSELALQARQRQHPVLLQRGRELLGRQAIDLVATVGDEVEDEAEFPELLGEALHLLVVHARWCPS